MYTTTTTTTTNNNNNNKTNNNKNNNNNNTRISKTSMNKFENKCLFFQVDSVCISLVIYQIIFAHTIYILA